MQKKNTENKKSENKKSDNKKALVQPQYIVFLIMLILVIVLGTMEQHTKEEAKARKMLESMGADTTINTQETTNSNEVSLEAKGVHRHNFRLLSHTEEGSESEESSSTLESKELTQEEKEYQAYLNSDGESEIYLLYDKTKGNYLYFREYNPSSTIEFKVNKSQVQGGIEAMLRGDLARIIYNGAIIKTDEEYELVKVYQIYNQSEEDDGGFQEIQSEDSGSIEEEGVGVGDTPNGEREVESIIE